METFQNASFVPMFLEDLYFANATLRKQAEEACQGDINCLFDSASTKDVSIGASTKAVSSTLEKESSSLSKYILLNLFWQLILQRCVMCSINHTKRCKIKVTIT